MRHRAQIIVLLIALSGCTGHLLWAPTPAVTPARAGINLPERLSSDGSGERLNGRWWEGFEDTRLTAMIDEVLRANLGLRQAWARLAQARAIVSRTGAGLWPEVSGDAEATTTKQVFFAGDELGGAQSFRSDQLLGTFAATWELDLWNRIGALTEAAEADRVAARDDAEAMALSIVAETADTWFSLVEQNAQHRLLGEQREVSDRLRELIELRFAQGISSAPDLLRQKEQVASIEAQIPLVTGRITVLEHRLSVLTGRPPARASSSAGDTLADPPPLPGVGLPGEILLARPDVRAAARRVAATDHRVAAAIAERFPAIRLTGRTGWQGFETVSLPENWIWTVVGNLATPLFDAGRRRAEVARLQGVLEERLAAWGESVLRALEEVENALVQEDLQREHIGRLEDQSALAHAALREIRNRYVNGLTDYLDVLTALATVQGLERQELTARRQLLSLRIQLHRALGGTWTERLTPTLVTKEDSHVL